MPSFEVILEAVCDFFRAGAHCVPRNAANMPDALAVALLADKDARNMVAPVDSPWPAFSVLTGGVAAASGQLDEGMSPFTYLSELG